MFFNHKKLKSPFNYLSRGFTLTEVLVIVLVIAVLMAIAYPLYTKAISKARAVEAINLLEIVRTKQVTQYVRSRKYYDNFRDMGQLTNNKAAEHANGTSIKINDYTVKIDNQKECLTAEYNKGGVKFTMSASYSKEGLGCTGNICESFGSMVGKAEDVCAQCSAEETSSEGCSGGQVQTCNNGKFGSCACPSGQVLQNGVCVVPCTPGATKKDDCTDRRVKVCGSNGQWGTTCTCPPNDVVACMNTISFTSYDSSTCTCNCGESLGLINDQNGNCVCPAGETWGLSPIGETRCLCTIGAFKYDDCPEGQRKRCTTQRKWSPCECENGGGYVPNSTNACCFCNPGNQESGGNGGCSYPYYRECNADCLGWSACKCLPANILPDGSCSTCPATFVDACQEKGGILQPDCSCPCPANKELSEVTGKCECKNTAAQAACTGSGVKWDSDKCECTCSNPNKIMASDGTCHCKNGCGTQSDPNVCPTQISGNYQNLYFCMSGTFSGDCAPPSSIFTNTGVSAYWDSRPNARSCQQTGGTWNSNTCSCDCPSGTTPTDDGLRCGCEDGLILAEGACYCPNDCYRGNFSSGSGSYNCDTTTGEISISGSPYIPASLFTVTDTREGAAAYKNSTRCTSTGGTWNGINGSPRCDCNCGEEREPQADYTCKCKNLTAAKNTCETTRGGKYNESTCNCDCASPKEWVDMSPTANLGFGTADSLKCVCANDVKVISGSESNPIYGTGLLSGACETGGKGEWNTSTCSCDCKDGRTVQSDGTCSKLVGTITSQPAILTCSSSGSSVRSNNNTCSAGNINIDLCSNTPYNNSRNQSSCTDINFLVSASQNAAGGKTSKCSAVEINMLGFNEQNTWCSEGRALSTQDADGVYLIGLYSNGFLCYPSGQYRFDLKKNECLNSYIQEESGSDSLPSVSGTAKSTTTDWQCTKKADLQNCVSTSSNFINLSPEDKCKSLQASYDAQGFFKSSTCIYFEGSDYDKFNTYTSRPCKIQETKYEGVCHDACSDTIKSNCTISGSSSIWANKCVVNSSATQSVNINNKQANFKVLECTLN